MSGATTASMARGLGTLGKYGSMGFLPLAVAEGAMAGIDTLAFDPYIAQRSMSDNLRSNFSGITFGGNYGNTVSGRGFSRTQSADTARSLSIAGARDLTFSQKEYGQLTDYISRSGILDGVDANKISGEMQSIVRQMKAVMAIAKTPGFKEATELTAKLVRSGSRISDISSNISAIGGFASGSGISVQRFMETTGLQGQFLAQSKGLTPLAGMMVAGQANAAYATAFRSGLLSETVMARMGGVEGATQSATSGVMRGLQNNYTMMLGMNSLYGKGVSSSLVGDMSAFGGLMSKNPVAVAGMMKLLQPAIMSNIMNGGNGAMALHNQMMKIAQTNPSVFINKNGGMDSSQAYQILTQVMGVSDDEARGVLGVFSAASNPKTYAMQQKAITNEMKNQQLDWARQNSRDLGILTGPWARVTQAGRAMQEWASNNRGLELLGAIGDDIESGWFGARVGPAARVVTAEDAKNMEASKTYSTLKRKNKQISQNAPSFLQGVAISAINSASAKGDLTAQKFFKSKGIDQINAVYGMAEAGTISKAYLDPTRARELVSIISDNYDTATSTQSPLNLEAELAKSLRLSATSDVRSLSKADQVEMIAATGILQRVESGEVDRNSPEAQGAIKKLSGLIGGSRGQRILDDGLRSRELDELAQDMNASQISGIKNWLAESGNLEKFRKDTKGLKDHEIPGYLLKEAKAAGIDILSPTATENSMAGLLSLSLKDSEKRYSTLQKQSASLAELKNNSKIGDTEYLNMQAALDMNKAVLKFDYAVSRLLEGKTSSPSTSTERKPFLSEDSIKTMKSLPWIGHYFEPRQ